MHLLTRLAMSGGIALGSAVAHGQFALYWSITDIAPSSGFTSAHATGINASGHICGYMQNGSSTRAFFYNGTVHLLGSGTGSVATGINDSDQIIGTSGAQVAYWLSPASNPSTTSVPTPFDYGSQGLGINSSGAGAGSARPNATDGWIGGYTWSASGTTVSGSAVSFDSSHIWPDWLTGIDDSSNTIGGYVTTIGDPEHGLVNNVDIDPDDAYDSSTLRAIKAGHWVGTAWGTHYSSINQAALWKTSYKCLGAIVSGGLSDAYGMNVINGHNDVVGASEYQASNSRKHAFYMPAADLSTSTMQDCNQLISPTNRGIYELLIATGINVHEAICGDDVTGGDMPVGHAFILNPPFVDLP